MIDHSQRRKRVHISSKLLADWFTTGNQLAGVVSSGLPEGSTIVGCQSIWPDKIELSIENPAFDPVVPGAVYPLLDITIKTEPKACCNPIKKPLRDNEITK
jgi:hypothetical protein